MKKLILSFLLLFELSASAQNIELIAGINQNEFFDFNKDEGHFKSSYKADRGYTLRIGIEEVKVDWLIMRFTLSYDKYGGELTASDGGLGGRYTTSARVNKSIISLGLFPVNIRIIDRIDLNFGLEFSGLVDENFEGIRSGWMMGSAYWSEELNDSYKDFSAKTYFGLRGRIAYDLKLTERLMISPQISTYFGLSREFDEFPEATKSMRHSISLGIQKNFN